MFVLYQDNITTRLLVQLLGTLDATRNFLLCHDNTVFVVVLGAAMEILYCVRTMQALFS